MLARTVCFVLLGLSVALLSCSKDRPAPIAPAGKSLASLAAPHAPTNLRFDAPTDSSCKVRWDASDGATDYDVDYKLAVGGKWTNEPHRGTRLYNTIHDLEPDTEYRWAVRAENSDGASEWVFGPNFTTTLPEDTGENSSNQIVSTNPSVEHIPPKYIRMFSDGSLTPEERSIVVRAGREWDKVVASGYSEGIRIDFSTSLRGRWARIDEYVQVNGFDMPKKCFVSLSPLDSYNYDDYSREENEQFYRVHVLHEIGHCLGIGAGKEWFDRVEYIDGWNWSKEPTEKIDNGDGTFSVRYEKVDGPIAPSFTGRNAQLEFIRLAENQWGDYPYVPLDWDRSNGPDPAHLSDPILSRSVMAAYPADYGNYPYQKVSSMEAAILEDLGYVTDKSEVEQTKLIAGYRTIWVRHGHYKSTSGKETLFFPAAPLVFWPEGRDRGYMLQEHFEWREFYIGHPDIIEENIFWYSDHDQEEDGAGKAIVAKNLLGVE